ncbi:hypothetical protein [Bradyrhizobium sp.]|uniref:hypothetical protein n=1 Tax=Bradyrhizobium sp. TaxID=376 RepID=UPI002C929E48|nr:hypothetical protein [Bradyrhizobium sp.]HWX64206.1 hypothetical protein [Bradyrhizobium sp.]
MSISDGEHMGIFGNLLRGRSRLKIATKTAVFMGPHISSYFDLPRIRDYSEDWKRKVKADFDAKTLGIIEAENPLLALRQQIADAALWHADYQVLSLTAKDKAESFYADCDLVSDELHYTTCRPASSTTTRCANIGGVSRIRRCARDTLSKSWSSTTRRRIRY